MADHDGHETSNINPNRDILGPGRYRNRNVELSAGRRVKISSTLIRDLLANGNVADAAIALGRPYRLLEKVIPGRGKGKRLGFATANIKPPPQVIPAEGVYAGLVEVADSQRQLYSASGNTPAALSIGTSATYGDLQSLLVEAHLLKDNVGELRGKYLAMDFVKLIRPQRKFDSESDLAAQIAKDGHQRTRSTDRHEGRDSRIACFLGLDTNPF